MHLVQYVKNMQIIVCKLVEFSYILVLLYMYLDFFQHVSLHLESETGYQSINYWETTNHIHLEKIYHKLCDHL